MNNLENTQTAVNLAEPCGADWRNHWLRLPFPRGDWRLTDKRNGEEIPFQLLSDGIALCRVDLPANGRLHLVWVEGRPQPTQSKIHVTEDGDIIVIGNGIIEIKLRKTIPAGKDVSGPLLGIRQPGMEWTGKSSMKGTVINGTGHLIYHGQLAAGYVAEIMSVGGGKYQTEFELLAGESFVRVKESMRDAKGNSVEFDFSEYHEGLLAVNGLPGSPAVTCKAKIHVSPYGVASNVMASLGSQCICGQIGSPWFMLGDSRSAVGAVVCRGGDWMYPGDNTLHLVRKENSILLEGEIKHGSREWLLVTGNALEWIPAEGKSADALLALKTRICDMPLDRVSHWVVDVDDISVEPSLWTDSAGLARAMQKLDAPEWDKLLAGIEHIKIEQREYAEELARQITDWAAKRAEWFVKYGLTGGGGLDYVALRPLKHCLYWYDLLRGSGHMNPEDGKKLRRALLFCAYCAYERDYFDWESAYAPTWSEHSLRRFLLEEDYSDTIGCQNFHADVFTFIGMSGLAFPEHPMSETWIRHSEQMALANLEYFVTPDGTYVESDNYYQHFLGLVYYMGVALYRAGHPAVLSHPRMKAGLEYWVNAQTPPLKYTGSPQTAWFGNYSAKPQQRPLSQMINVGDSGLNWGGQALPPFLHHAANHYAKTDPGFAGKLEWAWLRGASPLLTHCFIIQELLVQEITGPRPEAYQQGSKIFMGHGVMMRSKVGKPNETGVFVRVGRATSHMHFDCGGVVIWHAGVPLVVDPGYVHDEFTTDRQYGGASWKHSTVTFDIHGIADCSNGYLGNGYIGMEHMPDPLAVHLDDDYDYIECDLSQNNIRARTWREIRRIVTIEHYRQVLYAKRRNYVIIKDRIYRSIYPALWHLHVMGNKEEINGNAIRIHGRYGVDLMVTFVQPSAPEIRFEQKSSVRHISVRQDPERDFLAVLQPLCSGDEAYHVSPAPNGAEVSGGKWSEHIILDPLPDMASAGEWHSGDADEKEKSSQARCAVVRKGKTLVIHK